MIRQPSAPLVLTLAFAASCASAEDGPPGDSLRSGGDEEVFIGAGFEPGPSVGGGVVAAEGELTAVLENEDQVPWGDWDIEPDLAPVNPIEKPEHFGHYCSMTWPEGGWAAAWDTTGKDPCGWIEEQSDPGGTIERAGMFDAKGMNRVVARCGGAVFLYEGWGTGPLDAAFGSMVDSTLPSCIMTVAPRDFPFAKSPFFRLHEDDGGHKEVWPGSGFDFEMDTAAPNYDMSPVEKLMNNLGKWKSGGSPDDHKGNDFAAPGTTPLYPIAPGQIFSLNSYATNGCPDPIQEEVYIEHTIQAFPPLYSETFLSYYAHVDFDADLSQGQGIEDWQSFGEIGEIGEVGCGSAEHLHFGIMKVTNTTWKREATINTMSAWNTPCGAWPWACGESYSGKPFTFESFGYHADLLEGQEFDPWSWRGSDPWGTLASTIWIDGLEPPQSGWFK